MEGDGVDGGCKVGGKEEVVKRLVRKKGYERENKE